MFSGKRIKYSQLSNQYSWILRVALDVGYWAIYFVSYVVIDKGTTPLEYKQVLSERDYRKCYEQFGHTFEAQIGAEAIQTLLKQVDLDAEFELVSKELKEAQGQKRTKLLKRLEAIEAFRSSDNQPEWMILEALPVIPPDLRPMLQLDGGRFATSDLNLSLINI